MLKGKEKEAIEVLKKTVYKRRREYIEDEINDIKKTIQPGANQGFLQNTKILLRWSNLKR